MSDEELIARLNRWIEQQVLVLVDSDLLPIRDRIEALTAKLAQAVEVIEWALISWDEHNKYGHDMQGDWVFDARTILAEIKGESHD